MKSEQIKDLLGRMTLEEKVGQLSQITGEHYVGKVNEEMVETGPDFSSLSIKEEALYTIGSIIGVSSAKITNLIQAEYLKKSRLKIPLLFMHDAIHGYKTIFPIPLALSCSWDEEVVQKTAEEIASELRAAGIHVNFSPMVDLVRDARWGRVMESFGEDPILSGVLGKAMVRGYQKSDGRQIPQDGVASCLKHFAAYGGAIAGKDYNAVDMSMREFFEYYGKTYEIALEENPRFVMSSFNSFNGVPVSASKELLRDILQTKYHFEDILISDWGSVAELQNHRVAASPKEAADLAIQAGIEIEMVSTTYLQYLEELIEENPALLEYVDRAVLKILHLKNDLGLFENPYVDEEKEKTHHLKEETLRFAKEASKKSCVLLKNNQVLPINKNTKRILIVGPFSSTRQLLGNWHCKGKFEDVISLKEGLIDVAPQLEVQAYETLEECPAQAMRNCDFILVAIGENWQLSGEGHSSVQLELEPLQRQLIKDVKSLGIPYACICFSGRPLALQNIVDDIPALLWSWFPGTQAGTAIAELIMGKDTPSGKLTMSFPRHSAQVPIYYNEYSSGRPANDSSYSNRYQDCEIGPLFNFGHGLTYTNTTYSDFQLSDENITENNEIIISFKIHNPSDYDYSEIVILYIEDVISQTIRPEREMKKFKTIPIAAKQSVKASMTIQMDDLKYVNSKLKRTIERGNFNIYINDTTKPIFTIEY
ncbi:glycoside hydrolase family 3 N-terminal domain-containing protein [Falsibacillus albus]|uniref:beta-glucosidase n=1 Tax=Falsibacillus albus TaxID=2478915 RepID=A0A3L7JU22_9BACI|nr:glycoside hydrolase family 3 N-terminal domain-containing protein [Falsibacillus albus]RLQ94020.1 beta-glucosidase [Falsibacillus albus]